MNMFFLSQVFLTYWCLDRLYTILDLKAANAVVIQKGRNIITGVLKQISLYSARIIPYFQFLLVCLTLLGGLWGRRPEAHHAIVFAVVNFFHAIGSIQLRVFCRHFIYLMSRYYRHVACRN